MDISFNLVDGSTTVGVTITITQSAVSLTFDPLKTGDSDGIPAVFEVHDGELRQLQYCFEDGDWSEYPEVTPLLPPVEEEEETERCPTCDGVGSWIGCWANATHFQCRQCGLKFSRSL